VKIPTTDALGNPVPLKTVYRFKCPTCGAAVGWGCTTRGFGGDRSPHATRLSLAETDDNMRDSMNAERRRAEAKCMHGAIGMLYHLQSERHGGAVGLEWCPGCGAHRTLPDGAWIEVFR
jgi:hypothetical protein